MLQAKLAQIRQAREEGDRGFTLIELLVVVVIIGILVAIAIPLYLHFRQGAENKSAESDIRNAVSSVEQYFADNNQYPAALTDANVDAHTSHNNTLWMKTSGTAPTGYSICGTNSDGGTVYGYTSLQTAPTGFTSGQVVEVAAADATSACGTEPAAAVTP